MPPAGSPVPQQLGEVLDDDVGAVFLQRLRLADAIDANHEPELAGPPGATAASRSSNTLAAAGSSPRAFAPARYVSGAGLPRRCCSSATTPSIRASNMSSMPAAISTSLQLALDDTTARGSPASLTARRYATEPGYACTPSLRILRSTISFWRLPRPCTVSAVGGSSSLPSGRWMPRDSRNDRVPSARGLPSTYSS